MSTAARRCHSLKRRSSFAYRIRRTVRKSLSSVSPSSRCASSVLAPGLNESLTSMLRKTASDRHSSSSFQRRSRLLENSLDAPRICGERGVCGERGASGEHGERGECGERGSPRVLCSSCRYLGLTLIALGAPPLVAALVGCGVGFEDSGPRVVAMNGRPRTVNASNRRCDSPETGRGKCGSPTSGTDCTTLSGTGCTTLLGSSPPPFGLAPLRDPAMAICPALTARAGRAPCPRRESALGVVTTNTQQHRHPPGGGDV